MRKLGLVALAFAHALVGGAAFLSPVRVHSHPSRQKAKKGEGLPPAAGDGIPNPFKAIGNLFKPKEEKPKSEIERMIDESTKGAGPLGMLVGGAMKGLAKAVESSMADAMKDTQEVTDATERALRFDRSPTLIY